MSSGSAWCEKEQRLSLKMTRKIFYSQVGAPDNWGKRISSHTLLDSIAQGKHIFRIQLKRRQIGFLLGRNSVASGVHFPAKIKRPLKASFVTNTTNDPNFHHISTSIRKKFDNFSKYVLLTWTILLFSGSAMTMNWLLEKLNQTAPERLPKISVFRIVWICKKTTNKQQNWHHSLLIR